MSHDRYITRNTTQKFCNITMTYRSHSILPTLPSFVSITEYSPVNQHFCSYNKLTKQTISYFKTGFVRYLKSEEILTSDGPSFEFEIHNMWRNKASDLFQLFYAKGSMKMFNLQQIVHQTLAIKFFQQCWFRITKKLFVISKRS